MDGFAPISAATFALLQVLGPEDCVLSGTCGLVQDKFGPHSGVMFTALGLVLAGLLGLRALRRHQKP